MDLWLVLAHCAALDVHKGASERHSSCRLIWKSYLHLFAPQGDSLNLLSLEYRQDIHVFITASLLSL